MTLLTSMMIATFGGGCFWCTETIFQHVEGVEQVLPGYMGGDVVNPTYEQVCNGTTGHAEVIHIKYDPNKVSFTTLLGIFFETHDPTTLNRQGNDVGTQYRSAVFYHDDLQKASAKAMIEELEKQGVFDDRIVTEVTAASVFYEAEDYHKDYFNRNPNNPYCAAVIAPKLNKFLQNYQATEKNK